MQRSHTTYWTIAALVLLGAMVLTFARLGYWQLDRAAQRDAIRQTMSAGRGSPPLTLAPGLPAAELLPWRPASARGVWLDEFTVLLDNRNYKGRPGYWVATPLLLDKDSRSAVLVLRGWLARPLQEGKPRTGPAVDAPDGEQVVTGELLDRVPRLFELWSRDGGAGTSLPATLSDPAQALPRVQNLAIADLARATGLNLLPAVLAERGPTERGPTGPGQLVREWPDPPLDSDKNRGYALQWFGFSVIAAGAWLIVAWRALRRALTPKHL
ncbi:MAG TPA: SURF1 family protein [Candidimonas sp.]|nr:SURF1 family protein [Candidimonas sp.]